MGSNHHLLVMAPHLTLGCLRFSPLVLTTHPRRALTRKSQVSLGGWSSRCICSFYVLFLILSTYTVVCLSHGLFYSPCLDYTVFGYFALPGTVGTRLHSSCLHPRRVFSRPSFFHEYHQRDWEESDPGEMARGLRATEREPAWYCRADEFHKGARGVPPLSRYQRYRHLRLRRLNAELLICGV